jgi:hypothetical protein
VSTVLDDFDSREERDREDAKRIEQERERAKGDWRAAMEVPAMRRLLAQFLDTSGIDTSSYRDNPTAMAFTAGWQDAARWWLANIREHCPEREAQLRAEAKREAREGATNEDQDGPE